MRRAIDQIDWNRLARERERLRVHGTDNPFCCACGEHHWAVRFELNHILGRKHDDRVMRLCHSCHDKVSDMQKDYPAIPKGTDPVVAKLIAMTRGRIINFKLFLELDEELEALLTGRLQLPKASPPQTDGARDDE